jgi:hypothetical protein
LSAYPNLVSGHAFGGGSALIAKGTRFVTVEATDCMAVKNGMGSCMSPISYTAATALNIDRDSRNAPHPVTVKTTTTYCIDGPPKSCITRYAP